MPDRVHVSPPLADTAMALRPALRLRWLAPLGGIVLGLIGFAVVADSQVRQSMLGPAQPATGEGTLTRELVQNAGFQRRGALLVGELTTRDGTPVRLVLDGRTQALVGFRVLERPAAAPLAPNEDVKAPLPAAR